MPPPSAAEYVATARGRSFSPKRWPIQIAGRPAAPIDRPKINRAAVTIGSVHGPTRTTPTMTANTAELPMRINWEVPERGCQQHVRDDGADDHDRLHHTIHEHFLVQPIRDEQRQRGHVSLSADGREEAEDAEDPQAPADLRVGQNRRVRQHGLLDAVHGAAQPLHARPTTPDHRAPVG
eukprot:7382819-Prymnesium_polylepis.2